MTNDNGDENVVKLFGGDQRAATLYDALMSTIYERGLGMAFPTILGVVELVKQGVMSDALGQGE